MESRDNKSQRMSQMRGILDHQPSFAECLANETDVALCQVSYASVGELRRATRGPFGEVRFFHEQRAQAAGSGFDSCAQTGRATANHQAIPDR
jgi:hypothetical protein